MNNHKNNSILRDAGIIFLSILLAVVLAKTGAAKELLIATRGAEIIGSFLAGIFFVSIFTVAPATAALAEIARSNSIFLVAVFGGFGALIGDLVIFRFIKDNISQDIAYLIGKSRSKRLGSVFHLRLFKWLTPFLGALVVASPLPDEIGLAMMGLSKMKTIIFIPLSFLLNSVGILIIGLIAKMLQ